MIRLHITCAACPEQYDAYDENGKMVGYLRLRHGRFTVTCPDVGGELVYSAVPNGDGFFEHSERDYYLRFAVGAIKDWMNKKKPLVPDVEYEIWDDTRKKVIDLKDFESW